MADAGRVARTLEGGDLGAKDLRAPRSPRFPKDPILREVTAKVTREKVGSSVRTERASRHC